MLGNPPSLAAFFETWRKNPGVFLRFEGGIDTVQFSYEAAARAAVAFAARLRSSGIAKGERVIFWGDNRPQWVIGLWGCVLEGVIAVPIDFRSSARVVEQIASIVNARTLLIGAGLNPPENLTCPVWPLRDVVETDSDAPAFAPATPDDTAEILFTSGATGDPKGVTITHRNILANLKPIDTEVDKYRKYIGPFAPIRFLDLLPLSHMFGQVMAAFIPPMIAGEVFFISSYSPEVVMRLTRKRRISVLVCVPQMMQLLRDYVVQAIPEADQPPRSAKWYLRWWQYRRIHRRFGWKFWAFVVGAAPLAPDLEEFWRKLGFLVIQGYGLTETAPVATLNHPFHPGGAGTVGKPISGVEIRIAPDGEVLLRGENITPGYFGVQAGAIRDAEGWLHTGDVGELDADNRLKILGRKKEMIVLPDGSNVFPEDVERVLNAIPGVRESAVVPERQDSREQVHAVLVLNPGADADSILNQANGKLETHQRIRGFSLWPQASLPRTSGTNKLKRGEVAAWVAGAATGKAAPTAADSSFEDVIRKFTGGRQINADTSLGELGLSSLDRIQLMMELEQRTGTPIDESQFANARTVADLARIQPTSTAPSSTAAAAEPFKFPEWNRSLPARTLRHIALPGLILPLERLFAWIRIEGLENLRDISPPVIFAANHQSHLDAPAILWSLPARWRYRVTPAMAKEFFDAHFHPERYPFQKRFTNSLNYYLASLVFNAFPLPQREAGTRDALRYAGELAADGFCILIFPEGKRTDAGEIQPFQPGVGMLASHLHIPVVPVRLKGLERVLHKSARFPTPGAVRVKFGTPLRLEGADYAGLAKKIEEAVRAL